MSFCIACSFQMFSALSQAGTIAIKVICFQLFAKILRFVTKYRCNKITQKNKYDPEAWSGCGSQQRFGVRAGVSHNRNKLWHYHTSKLESSDVVDTKIALASYDNILDYGTQSRVYVTTCYRFHHLYVSLKSSAIKGTIALLNHIHYKKRVLKCLYWNYRKYRQKKISLRPCQPPDNADDNDVLWAFILNQLSINCFTVSAAKQTPTILQSTTPV